MDMGLLFWFLMILWGLSCVGTWMNKDSPWFIGSSQLLEWILFALVGWRVFGPILH